MTASARPTPPHQLLVEWRKSHRWEIDNAATKIGIGSLLLARLEGDASRPGPHVAKLIQEATGIPAASWC